VRVSNSRALIRARDLRQGSTPAEEALWARIRDRQLLGLKFRRQAPIGPYVADFLCHELRLVLELDGSVHEEPAQISHDVNRDANLGALGFRVLRVTNQQIATDLDSVLRTIAHLHHNRSVSPLSRPEGGEAGREGPGE